MTRLALAVLATLALGYPGAGRAQATYHPDFSWLSKPYAVPVVPEVPQDIPADPKAAPATQPYTACLPLKDHPHYVPVHSRLPHEPQRSPK